MDHSSVTQRRLVILTRVQTHHMQQATRPQSNIPKMSFRPMSVKTNPPFHRLRGSILSWSSVNRPAVNMCVNISSYPVLKVFFHGFSHMEEELSRTSQWERSGNVTVGQKKVDG